MKENNRPKDDVYFVLGKDMILAYRNSLDEIVDEVWCKIDGALVRYFINCA